LQETSPKNPTYTHHTPTTLQAPLRTQKNSKSFKSSSCPWGRRKGGRTTAFSVGIFIPENQGKKIDEKRADRIAGTFPFKKTGFRDPYFPTKKESYLAHRLLPVQPNEAEPVPQSYREALFRWRQGTATRSHTFLAREETRD